MGPAFEKLVEKETTPEASGVTALGLLAVNKSGESFIEKYYGRKSAISDEKVTRDSAFWIYSVTKTFTAIAALQCVERGQIALDDEVYGVLPELKDFQIISIGNDQSQLSFTSHKEKITLRRLLSHTSGIGVDAFDPRLQAWRMSRGEHTQAFCGDSKKAYTLPLLFEPGQGWAYGGGVEWAGILVGRLNGGVTLGEYMRQHILEPLGMADTTFHPDRNPAMRDRLVTTSIRISDGTLVPMEGPYPAATQDDSGAMGLVSTVPDMAKLTADLLRPQPTVLSATSVEELFTPQFAPDSQAAQFLSYGAVMYGRLIGEEYSPDKVGQVPGAYFIKKDTKIMPGNTLVMTGIPNLVWFVNREKGVGGLYASAVMPPDDAKSAELIASFIKEVFSN